MFTLNGIRTYTIRLSTSTITTSSRASIRLGSVRDQIKLASHSRSPFPLSSSQTQHFSSSALSRMKFPGSCYCRAIKYEIDLASKDDARTSICHCKNCKKFTGGNYGITTKLPKSAFKLTKGEEEVKVHEADNGSGVVLRREFCGKCGSGLLEYGANAGDFIYIFYGTMDKPDELPPKGEFFCKYRDSWMPEVPDIFHKNEIKT